MIDPIVRSSSLQTIFPWLFKKDRIEMVQAKQITSFVSQPLQPAPAPVIDIDGDLKAIQADKPPNILEFEEFESYEKLAAELDMDISPDLADKLFKSFCKAHDIPVYDLKSVISYMDAVVQVERKKNPLAIWFWRPLTKNDCYNLVGYSNQYRSLGNKNFDWRIDDKMKNDMAKPYNKPIPRYVLERAKKIIQQFGKDERGVLNVTVSDYESAAPDPFLMVQFRGHSYVIAVWDEPSYT